VRSYEHVDPSVVGNERRVLCSDLSGRANVLYKAGELGLGDLDPETAGRVLARIKELENGGFSFESAEASVAMMMRRARPGYAAPFELVDFMVVAGARAADATVKVNVGEERVHVAASGNGPVHALDTALRKALRPFHPEIADFELADYKVRILDGRAGTGAKIRVLIDTQTGARRWTTVGASTNIIDASATALVDSLEYGLAVAATVAR
jgi:2-isopropylmalate synthase